MPSSLMFVFLNKETGNNYTYFHHFQKLHNPLAHTHIQSYYQQVPPSLARFSREEPDIVVYTGYGMQKQLQFYSLAQRKVLRTATLTHWATALDLSLTTPLIAIGINGMTTATFDLKSGGSI